MARPLVILHGWSDTAESFDPLARLLKERLGQEISQIRLGDYLSMEDEVRFDDLACALEAAWKREGLPVEPGSVDMVVHSTGGLVVRAWMREFFLRRDRVAAIPLKHLVMLAPANFGSHLAHKGTSFLARATKGWVAKAPTGKAFETGTQILSGLELGSPFTWDLARDDLFDAATTPFHPDRVRCTVLVGNSGYSGIQAIANEAGSDGTVRISTANLECVAINASFPANPEDEGVGHDVTFRVEESQAQVAFGIVDGINHSEITFSHLSEHSLSRVERRKREGPLLDQIVKGLKITKADFPAWRRSLREGNAALAPKKVTSSGDRHGYQNTVIHVVDQFGVGVSDYLLEGYEHDTDRSWLAERFHKAAIRKVHPFRLDTSYRSFNVDVTRLTSAIDRADEVFSLSLCAQPEIGEDTPVGFTTISDEGIGGIRIPADALSKFFAPHRTALVTLQLERQQRAETFQFRPRHI